MSIRPTFYGIQIGYSGLQTSQKGLDVTGHNISNVDTVGYTRQRIVQQACNPYNGTVQWRPVDKALVGGGSSVLIHDQIRSTYLDRQFRTEQSLYSQNAVHTQGLSYIEGLFEGSKASNITTSIYNLFAAFNDNTKDGHDRDYRQNIYNAALTLVQNSNLIYDKMIEHQEGRDDAVYGTVSQINNLAQNIADLNKAIYRYEMNGLVANDLRDQRNLALDELSALVDVQYEYYVEEGDEPFNTKLRVSIGGEVLLDHTRVRGLECVKTENPIPGEPDVWTPVWSDSVTWEEQDNPAHDPNNPDPDIPPKIMVATDYRPLEIIGGELAGHIAVRDGGDDSRPGLPYFLEMFNNLIRTVVKEINAVHREGYTHPLSGEDSRQGVNFFEEPGSWEKTGVDAEGNDVYGWIPGDISEITAKTFKIDDAIGVDPYNGIYNIAASKKPITLDEVSGELNNAGNQENAMAIYDILNKQDIVLTVGGETFAIGSIEGGITSFLSDIGLHLQRYKNKTSNQASILGNADMSRLSLSGVSLDEEMTNLIKYQHAFNGASRVITTMDEAIETIINRMGRVGL